MTDNEKIAKWLGPFIKVSVGNRAGEIWPDSDILLWHSKDGLLEKIGERNVHEAFSVELGYILCAPGMASYHDKNGVVTLRYNAWDVLCATPAQLAAALVKVIDAEEKA